MKRILTLAICVFALGFSASAQFKFGAGANVFFNGGSIGIGAKAHNTFTDDIAGQASFHLYLENGSPWSLDLDVHYRGLDLGSLEDFSLSPFAGLIVLGTGTRTVAGINLGLNGTKSITDQLDLYIEPKFSIVSGESSLALAAGVYF